MGLKDTIKELETEIKKERGEIVEKDEAETHEEKSIEAPEKPVEAVEQKTEEKPIEAQKQPEIQKTDDILSGAERARLRILERENAELRRKKEEEPKKEAVKVSESGAEPDKEVDPIAWLEWRNKKLEEEVTSTKQAILDNPVLKRVQQRETEEAELRGFAVLENRFKSSVPDYEDVMSHMTNVIFNSYRALHPSAPQEQVAMATRRHVLDMANKFLEEGYENPVQVLYQLSKSNYGFQPKAPEQEKQAVVEEKKPVDLDRVEKAKAKSASAASGGREIRTSLGHEEFAKMSLAQKAKLSKAQIEELLKQA